MFRLLPDAPAGGIDYVDFKLFGKYVAGSWEPVAERNLWWWQNVRDSLYYISSIPGEPIYVTDDASDGTNSTLNRTWDFYNRQPVYSGSQGVLWRPGGGARNIISPILGARTRELFDVNTDTWTGDTWWERVEFFGYLEGLYEPRGENKNIRDTLTLSYGVVDGWVSETKYGEYVHTDSGSGKPNRYVGWRVYDADVESDIHYQFTESVRFIGASIAVNTPFFTSDMPGGNFLWKSGAQGWIISPQIDTFGTFLGYWQSPTLEGLYTRIPPSSGEAEILSDVTISFNSYSNVNRSQEQYFGQVAGWL